MLEHLREDDRAGLVTFNRIVLLSSTLTLDRVTIRNALGAAIPSGETSLRDGVFSGLTVADVGAGRALLVVFSDGIDTASWLPAPAVLDIARRADVVVYGISTGKAPFLEEISAVTGGAVFQGEWPTLSQTFLGVLDEFRRRYVLTYSPRGVETGGWHRLTVRVKGRSVRIKARAGYMGTSRP